MQITHFWNRARIARLTQGRLSHERLSLSRRLAMKVPAAFAAFRYELETMRDCLRDAFFGEGRVYELVAEREELAAQIENLHAQNKTLRQVSAHLSEQSAECAEIMAQQARMIRYDYNEKAHLLAANSELKARLANSEIARLDFLTQQAAQTPLGLSMSARDLN